MSRVKLGRPWQEAGVALTARLQSTAHLQMVRVLDRARLADSVEPQEIARWCDTPNNVFGGRKPLELIEGGEIDRLWDMIFYLELGVPIRGQQPGHECATEKPAGFKRKRATMAGMWQKSQLAPLASARATLAAR